VHQNDNVELFESILKDFNDNGILQDFILIGSWTLRVYSYHFKNDPQVPIVATQDLDLLVTNPPKVSREVDIPELLRKYDLEKAYSCLDGFSKFVSPDFEVEFLYPDNGTTRKRRSKPYRLPERVCTTGGAALYGADETSGIYRVERTEWGASFPK